MKKLLLTIIVVVLLGTTSFANCIGDISKVANAKTIGEYGTDTKADYMDSVTFGTYNGEPIEWIILRRNKKRALLLSKGVIEEKDFYHKNVKVFWEDSPIRQWLNEDFYNETFTDEEKSRIILSTNANQDYEVAIAVSDESKFVDLDETEDYVFLLSYSEARRYFEGYGEVGGWGPDDIYEKDATARVVGKDLKWNGKVGNKSSYWLRTTGFGQAAFHIWGDENKCGNSNVAGVPDGIRPAMWITYDANEGSRSNEFYYEEMESMSVEQESMSRVIESASREIESISRKVDDAEEIIEKQDEIVAKEEISDTITWGMNGIDATFRIADLKQGWVYDVEGKKFYFNTFDADAMSVNFPTNCWKEIDGKNYYFTNYGYVLTNATTPDGYQVDGNGVYIPKNGWQGDYYYENGNVVKNAWKQYGLDWYYCGSTGAIEKNKWIGEFYVDSTGKMLKNTTTPDGYQVDADGKKITTMATTKENVGANNNSTDMSGYFKVNEDTKIRYPGQMFMSVKKDDVLEVLRVEGDNAIVKNEGNDDEGTLSIKYLGEKVGDIAKTKDTNDLVNKNAKASSLISGMPRQESELRNDGHFYLDNNMQKSSWVYYISYYYHVDGIGNIEKSKWIEQRYVGDDGKMYRGRQTPDGKWVGDDGLVVKDVVKDLKNSALVEEIQSDAWYKTQAGFWYYFENDRTTIRKGWFTDNRDGQTYYLDPSTGIMAVGWTEIDGDMYYFNENGGTEPNWYEVGDGIYESYGKKIKSLGSMYKNETTLDGQEVDEDGKLKKDDDTTKNDMMIEDDNYIIEILQYSDRNIFKIKSLDVLCEEKQFLFFTISSKYYLHIYLDNYMLDGCKEIIEKSVGSDVFLKIDDELIEMTSENVSFDDESMIIHYKNEKGAENIRKKINDANHILFYLIKSK